MFLCQKFSKSTLPKVSSSAALSNVLSGSLRGLDCQRAEHVIFKSVMSRMCMFRFP